MYKSKSVSEWVCIKVLGASARIQQRTNELVEPVSEQVDSDKCKGGHDRMSRHVRNMGSMIIRYMFRRIRHCAETSC